MSLNGLGIWYCENMFLFLWSIIPTNRNESTKSYHLNLGNRSVSVDLTMKKTLKNILRIQTIKLKVQLKQDFGQY